MYFLCLYLYRHPLKLKGSREHSFVIPLDSPKKEIFRYKVRLPAYVTCSQCVLQWTYYTGIVASETAYITFQMDCKSTKLAKFLLIDLGERKMLGKIKYKKENG